ncbi:MAG: ABC transporter permease [Acidimicrobiales bacterium]|nr:ABC transporter permease [Acidimicrobiales bacterium]
MEELIAFTVVGVVTGAIYAVAASGLVLTYTTSGVFNIAHGAIGMLMAFVYWEIRFDWEWPAPIALVLVIGVIAPLFGVLVERTLARNLGRASLVSSLVVTIGLMLVLMGLAFNIWPPAGRRVPGFFSPGGVDLGVIVVSWHEVIAVATALVVAAGLRLLMFNTRTGVTMRAIVDHRPLATLTGARPARSSMLSWAIGSSLAAVAGILLAPVLQLNVEALTLLVVNAYAAAMVGRLQSVPLTMVGAVVLGLIESYAVGYLPSTGVFANVRLAIPTLMLFVVLLVIPEVRLRAGSAVTARMPKLPAWRRSAISAVALVAVAAAFTTVAADDTIGKVSVGLALGLIALSLVPLTGWAGQVSLCQLTLAGVGALAAMKVATDGSPIGLVVAALAAGAVGGVVALPALRLKGLYLALATLAFAALMDNVVFIREDAFGNFGSTRVERLELGGVSFAGERAYFILLATAFALVAFGLLVLRRSDFGRRLSALRDAPTACLMMGMNTTRTKLEVFALSSAIAGVGGALYAGLQNSASAADYTMFSGLPVVLLAVLGGITCVSGALVGGLVLAGFPVLTDSISWLESLALLGPGLIGITLARRPDGLVLWIADAWAGRVDSRQREVDEALPATVEDLGLAVPFEEAHLEAIDRELAIDGV